MFSWEQINNFTMLGIRIYIIIDTIMNNCFVFISIEIYDICCLLLYSNYHCFVFNQLSDKFIVTTVSLVQTL